MNYQNLNKVIAYIEKHLDCEIDYKEISRIVGFSEYSFQRIFLFLTDLSLTEYIRKRRLSRAVEELKNSNTKIIDIALKYNYSSSISFSRAFKQYFGVTPSVCRKNNREYKIFPVIKFDNKKDLYDEVNYEIKEIDTIDLYYYSVEAERHDDLLYKIRNLYRNFDDKIPKSDRYGIYMVDNNRYKYFLGMKNKENNMKKITIEGGKYAVFNTLSRDQDNIVKMYKFIYNEWIASTNYKVRDDLLNFEYYYDDNCYIYVPIR